MIVEVGGGKGGLKEYLEHGRKKGREFHRDQLDQRIALVGDLNVFEVATTCQDGSGDRYDHITLSFSESHVSDELLQVAAAEFRDHVFAAWPESERHRIAFYAEAHRPRILSYTNSETGERIERLTHIHIGLGKHDLATGAAVEPMGYLGPTADNIKYIDAWQESFNARHGLSSPKDNPKITPENAVDILARYSGRRPDALGTFNARKAALEIIIQKAVIAQGITTWAGLGQLLAKHGVVSKVREGQFGECYRIKPDGQTKAMRLQGVFFQRQFIERSTAEKVAIISDRARAAYLEQMQPRKHPQHIADTLHEWHQFKARENRYLHTGSAFYRNVYQLADAVTRLHLLDQIERNDHGIQSPSDARGRKITSTRSRVQRMPVRNMDGIQRRTEMLLRRDPGVDVRAAPGREEVGTGMRQADGDGERRDGFDDWAPDGPGVGDGESHGRPGTGIQPSSVLGRVHAELRERYEQAADKERYAEIRKNIDCALLLRSLSHSHGLTPERYGVVSAKDGTPRIQCGSRSLTPNDFLSKELGLPWREAAPILRTVYEQQIGMKVVRGREHSLQSALWKAFKADQLLGQAGQMEKLQQFDAETKLLRASQQQELKNAQVLALAGKFGAARKSALSLSKLEAATAKAQFSEQRSEVRKSLRPRQAEAWRLFLQVKAQAGDAKALQQLRRLDDSARSTPTYAITGTIHLPGSDDEKRRRAKSRATLTETLKALSHQVEINGDVTYSSHGRAVLRDEGHHVAVLDQNSEQAISAGLLLAREKFGTDLTLTGDAAFKRRVVAVAVAQGIQVRFVDPQLEAFRVQLLAENNAVSRPPVESAGRDERVPDAKNQIALKEHDEENRTPVAQSSFSELQSPQILKQPSLDEARAALVADLRGRGVEIREIVEGKQFVGRVHQVSDQFVVQHVALGAVVIHERGKLSGQYVVGQDAHIEYENGRGNDKNQRTNAMQKGKPGTER